MKYFLSVVFLSFFVLVKITSTEDPSPAVVDPAFRVDYLHVYEDLESCLNVRDPLQFLTLIHLYSCVEIDSDEIPRVVNGRLYPPIESEK